MNQQLVDNNFLYIPGFLSAQEADNLAEWMFISERNGELSKDTRWEEYNLFAYVAKDALPFVKLLVKKLPQVSKLCGVDVLPTYSYAVIYKNNSELIRHTDRDACEISLTVNLQKDEDWPICVKTPSGNEVCTELNRGDAVMYLGCITEHWRPNSYKGQNFVQTFLHYVNADGPRACTFFDKEKR